MSNHQETSVNVIENKNGWLSRRPIISFIVVALSIFPLISFPWTGIFQLLSSGELPIFTFILLSLFPILLMFAAFLFLFSKKVSLYFYISSLIVGVINLSLYAGSGRVVSYLPIEVIVIMGIIIYCAWLRRKGVVN